MYTDKNGNAWFDLDPSTFDQDTAKAYDEYRGLNQLAAQAREAFEAKARKALGPVAFGYKFGKLAISQDAYKPKATTPAKAKLSLDQWLAMREASGMRS